MLWGGHETITSMRMTVGVATKVSLGLLFEKTTTTTKEAEAVEAPGWMSTYCFNCYVNNINNLNWNVKNTFQFIFCHRIGIMQSTRLTMLLSVWNWRQPPAEEGIEVRIEASSVKWPLLLTV